MRVNAHCMHVHVCRGVLRATLRKHFYLLHYFLNQNILKVVWERDRHRQGAAPSCRFQGEGHQYYGM
jgi:hypothetical protein